MAARPSLKTEAVGVEVEVLRFVVEVVVVVVVVEEIAHFRFRCERAACRRLLCPSSRPENEDSIN